MLDVYAVHKYYIDIYMFMPLCVRRWNRRWSFEPFLTLLHESLGFSLHFSVGATRGLGGGGSGGGGGLISIHVW